MNELESEKIFDHHSVLPVFEEQVRCHAPKEEFTVSKETVQELKGIIEQL